MTSRLTACVDAGTIDTMLALPGIIAIAREAGVGIDWHPLGGAALRLSNSPPVESTDDPLAAYKARRSRARLAWAQRERERDCERLGIETTAAARRVDTRLLNAGLAWTLERGGDPVAWLNTAFDAAVREGRDAESAAVVAELIGAPDFVRFAEQDAPAKLEATAEAMLERGIYAAPAFIVDDEVFQGRQHFPLIRWLLGDRSGPPPV